MSSFPVMLNSISIFPDAFPVPDPEPPSQSAVSIFRSPVSMTVAMSILKPSSLSMSCGVASGLRLK